MANEEQARYWAEQAGPIWVELQERFDSITGPFGDLALEAASVGEGEAVVDVGCGCGGTLLALARRTGPRGRVTGVDISPVMLERARERVAAAGLDNVDLVLSDAQTGGLGSEVHDVLFSRFGVMFFDDPVAAFGTLRTSLRPGGRLALVCWQGPDRNRWLSAPPRALAGILELPPPPGPDEPSPFGLADPERILAVLGGAGFEDVSATGVDGTVRLAAPQEADRAAELTIDLGPGRIPYRRAAPDLQARAREAVDGVLAASRGPHGVIMPASAWVVTARV